MSQGFQGLTRQRRQQIASKGGKRSNEIGKAHKYNVVEATKASQKGVAARKTKAALKAAKKLLNIGFTAEQLYLLDLSEDQYIYYGGSRSGHDRYIELKARIEGEQNV